MASSIPRVNDAVLDDPHGLDYGIRLDTSQWFAWLDDPANTRFSYALHNRKKGYIDGFMTVRKERRQRGGAYWSVYRRQGHKLHKVYVGPSAALTLERLEEIAIYLRDPPATQMPKVTRQPVRNRM
ncbi:MAG: hypothetical protein KDD92_13705 [Caldilineaceae bacterium]|nr:hypothetical protein [Caldilineaceae bacterium]